MTEIAPLLAEILSSRGWEVQSGNELGPRLRDFDFVAESEAAIVFSKALSSVELFDAVPPLTAQIAAAITTANLGVKAWESYLLLTVTGISSDIEELVQSIQHDLSYCRKVVLDADRITVAEVPEAEAERLLAFLFPLETATVPSAIDVRQALTLKLVQKGTPEPLAQGLVENFEEAECKCMDRILEWAARGDLT